jgi:membrane protease YdiL (CAAX protease family)
MTETVPLSPGRARTDAAVALVLAPLWLALWRYRASPDALAPLVDGDVAAHALSFGAVFAVAALSLAFATVVRGRRLVEFGLGAPRNRRVLVVLLALIPVDLLCSYLGSRMPEVREQYPLARSLLADRGDVLLYEVLLAGVFYTAWEAYFRGYLLFSVASAHGGVAGVLVQTMASCLVHLGKPEAEVLLSVPTGILWGWMAWASRSIWPAWLLHALLGVSTDLFVLSAAP